MRVALVTTWQQACGIAEHSAYLKAAIEQAAPGEIALEVIEDLHPRALTGMGGWDWVLLNYHAALHSQWDAQAIGQMRQTARVLVIYHDSGVPNTEQAKSICGAADAFVVHEPYDDLPGNGRYWRMGVPDWPKGHHAWGRETYWKAWPDQPVLGSIGFPFPWKNYDELAKVTAINGWALYLIAPGATTEQIRQWQALNPSTHVVAGFADRVDAIRHLAACDATAFTYVCHNAGQSGAILLGIAARKPVIAFANCRQFRALHEDPLGRPAICWARSFGEVAHWLRRMPMGRVNPAIVALAEQESWRHLGPKFAQLLLEWR